MVGAVAYFLVGFRAAIFSNCLVYSGAKIFILCSQGIFSRSNRTLYENNFLVRQKEAAKSTNEWKNFFTSSRQPLGICVCGNLSILLSTHSFTASLPIILKFRHSA
jgi:hypothetical protein